jgi:hypothetical protein
MVSPTAGRLARLALIFFATVFGLVLLTLVFGSSPASAADGGSDDNRFIPAVAELVGGTVDDIATVAEAAVAIPATLEAATPTAPAATISGAVSGAVDGAVAKVLGQTFIGEALGSAPVGAVLAPVAKVIDSTITAVGDVVAPVLDVVPGLVPAFVGASADAATASILSVGATALSGTALGVWTGETRPLGTGPPGTSGVSLTTTVLPAAALGAAFLVLLMSRRLGLVNDALPVSPVYETDTSPD